MLLVTGVVLVGLVYLLHLAVVLFNLFGLALVYRYPKLRHAHAVSLGVTWIFFALPYHCPLTYIEYWIRDQTDPSGQAPRGFLIRLMEQILYLDVPPMVIFAPFTVLCGVCFYLYYFSSKFPK